MFLYKILMLKRQLNGLSGANFDMMSEDLRKNILDNLLLHVLTLVSAV